MKYTIQITIKAPRDKVVGHFESEEDLPKWQPGLLHMKHLSGDKGQEGSKTEMHFQHGKRRVEMVETILENNLPKEFKALYEAKGVKNWVDNEFLMQNENTTQWVLTSDFRCTGMLKLLTIFAPGMFKKATSKSMHLFRDLAEGKLS